MAVEAGNRTVRKALTKKHWGEIAISCSRCLIGRVTFGQKLVENLVENDNNR